MKLLDADERLPSTIGGLVDFGLAGWFARAPLYLAIAFVIFVAAFAADMLLPSTDELGKLRVSFVVQYVEIFGFALATAVVALGVAMRLRSDPPAWRALLGGAIQRWLPVLGTMIVVELVVESTLSFSGLGMLPDPPWIALLTAPITWLLWGAINLAAPLAALTGECAAFAMFTAFSRAIEFSLRRENLLGLCVVSFANVVPMLLSQVLYDVLSNRNTPHADFWASVPVDVFAVGPVAAIQTAFILDFARRAKRES